MFREPNREKGISGGGRANPPSLAEGPGGLPPVIACPFNGQYRVAPRCGGASIGEPKADTDPGHPNRERRKCP